MTVDLPISLSDRHRRTCLMLGLCLLAGDSDIWVKAPVVWSARLTAEERAALAFSVLRSLDPDQIQHVFDAVFSRFNLPPPPFLNPSTEASDWAAWADHEYVSAMAVACFNEMPPALQAEFRGFVGKLAA